MQKWHIHSAIGKGRPLPSSLHHQCTLTLPRHHFHTSSPHRKAGGREKVMEEVTTPLPNRAKRLEDASLAVQDLYLRHAGKDNCPTGHRNTGFESVPLKGAPEEQPAVIDARNMGVPFGKEVLEGKTFGAPRVDQRAKLRQERQNFAREAGAGAVDAKGLSAGSEGRLERGRYTMGRPGAVDARILGARPAQTIGLEEKPRLPPRAPRSDFVQTVGLEEKQRFPPRVPRSEHEDVEPRERQPRGQNSSIQERAPPRRPNDFQARTPRSDSQRVPREGRSARPRPPRDSEDGEYTRRRRGGGGGGGGHVNIWNDEEAEYMKQMKKREAAQTTEFNPHNAPLKGLIGYSPAIASGKLGISQILEESLALAKKHFAGEFIQWDSKEQQADVMALVEALKAGKAGKYNEGKEQENDEISKIKQQTDALLEKLWTGKYELTRPQMEKDILGHVARQTDRNESYYPEDEKSLLEKVRSILPADAGRAREQSAKQARK
ncbi:hypothetical protein ABVK25_001864 [Lepraria finkii]|uniref:Uncharacterized protein n=1 Tax=Lepraria finkii TaxID=1340010 RepID=A0ABR4BN32_9LECA